MERYRRPFAQYLLAIFTVSESPSNRFDLTTGGSGGSGIDSCRAGPGCDGPTDMSTSEGPVVF